MAVQVAQQVRRFIEENFVFREDVQSLTDTESLLEAGLIDSTGILEMVAFLEEQFRISVEDADLVPSNFDSVAAISQYVERALAARPAPE